MRVLLVDDSRNSLAYLTSLLQRCVGVEIDCFLDAEAALRQASKQRFDLAIVNHIMPGLDGVDFIALMRQTPFHEQIPMIMLTASEGDEVKIHALEVGATDFLSKSQSRLELSIRLHNAVELARALRKLEDHVASQAEEIEAATRTLLLREEEMVFQLSKALEFRDNDTNDHTYRVAHYSRLISERLGLPARLRRAIFVAAPLHDIGKVAVPDRILLKPGALDGEEREIIKTHAAVGARILSGSHAELIKFAATIAERHHERWDGAGYPDGLAREAIPLPARIVAIADVFDALTTVRPYKKALPLEEAVGVMLAERGHHFDPTCIDAFVAAIVELSGDPPSTATLRRRLGETNPRSASAAPDGSRSLAAAS
jgi:putative two-component system response regulator